MGTWGTDPFDNDEAADWCEELEAALPSERERMTHDALSVAATGDGYLPMQAAEAAVAAAAIVAARQAQGPAITSVYAPDFLTAGGTLELTEDLVPLALHAVDRIAGANSEWRELWEDSDHRAEAFAELAALRSVLARHVSQRERTAPLPLD